MQRAKASLFQHEVWPQLEVCLSDSKSRLKACLLPVQNICIKCVFLIQRYRSEVDLPTSNLAKPSLTGVASIWFNSRYSHVDNQAKPSQFCKKVMNKPQRVAVFLYGLCFSSTMASLPGGLRVVNLNKPFPL